MISAWPFLPMLAGSGHNCRRSVNHPIRGDAAKWSDPVVALCAVGVLAVLSGCVFRKVRRADHVAAVTDPLAALLLRDREQAVRKLEAEVELAAPPPPCRSAQRRDVPRAVLSHQKPYPTKGIPMQRANSPPPPPWVRRRVPYQDARVPRPAKPPVARRLASTGACIDP